MNRRLAVKHLSWLTGAAAPLPGCLSRHPAEQPVTYPLKHLSAEQERLLGEVCETILPRTTTPGGGYIPRFRNVQRQETDFLRGYAANFGASLKQQLEKLAPGTSRRA